MEHQLIGTWFQTLSEEQINEKLKILEMYGYREPDSKGVSVPFLTNHKGILSQGSFITNSQKYADGILMNVDVLYITALFGATALDIFTTSGARLGEVAQVHLGIGCLDQGSITDPETNTVKTSYMFRAIPKGRDEPAVFYVNRDTFDLIKEIAFYLRDVHYKGLVPKVEYRYRKGTGATQPEQPYLFQLHGKHFGDNAFACILNFICFGLIYETQDKKLVKLKPHLLRHGFATHAVQAEELPIDVVAMILNQKDLEVTAYYSQPTHSQVANVVTDFHFSMNTQVDMMKEVLRQPEELQELFKRQREISGPFVETKPGIGYPKDWENQERWNGGWVRRERQDRAREGGKWAVLVKIFAIPNLPRDRRLLRAVHVRLRAPAQRTRARSVPTCASARSSPASGWRRSSRVRTGRRSSAASSRSAADANFAA